MSSIEISSIDELPTSSAVYALCGGGGKRSSHIAYIGMTENLRRRINQHLIARDSSIATGTSPVGLKPDLVTEVYWWCDESFTDGTALAAAELIAFKVKDPALRSRAGIFDAAKSMSQDELFKKKMEKLFESDATGWLRLPKLQTLAAHVAKLEQRIAVLEAACKRRV
jgi:hypothetical protein